MRARLTAAPTRVGARVHLEARGGTVGVRGSCVDARGMFVERLVEGAHRSSMDELTAWTQWAEKVLVF